MKESTSVIVRTDGGICSQIAFYAYGKELETRGFNVLYDTSWFDEYGMDCEGTQQRNYDLERAFPSLFVRHSSPEMNKLFRAAYNQSDLESSSVKAPAYVGGYPKDRETLFFKYVEFFREHFHPVDANLCEGMLQKIAAGPSCAIHVRRGDLSQFHEAYGYPASAEYFVKAIEIVKSYNKNTTFYFFSDGMDFVRNDIVPRLGADTHYELMDSFGADKGYLDLYLISKADFIIVSHGSLGTFGKLLSVKNQLMISPRYISNIMNNYPNCIFINDGIREINATLKNKLAAMEQKPQESTRAGCLKRLNYALKIFFWQLPLIGNPRKARKYLNKLVQSI